MNESLVVYVRKDVFNEIDDKTIIWHFQSMRSHKEQLSKKVPRFEYYRFSSNLKFF